MNGLSDPSLNYSAKTFLRCELGPELGASSGTLTSTAQPSQRVRWPTSQMRKLRPQPGSNRGPGSSLLPLPSCRPACPAPLPRTHCRRRGASGCPARGRWGPRAGRSGWRRRGAASARRPPGVGSCAVSADCPGSPRRRAAVPAAATPGPATGGRPWPRARLAGSSCLPSRVSGSAIAGEGAGRPCRAAPRGPIGSLGGGAWAAGGGSGPTGRGHGPGADRWRGCGPPVGALRGRGQGLGGGAKGPLGRDQDAGRGPFGKTLLPPRVFVLRGGEGSACP